MHSSHIVSYKKGCLVRFVLIDLDGLRDIAINHGETSQDKFLYDIMKVVKAYIARDSENPSFSMMCLAPKPEW